MEVILQEDVPNLGKAGDVVAVKDGYGRNYLIPQKKALLADPKNLKVLEHQKRMVEASLAKKRKNADELAQRLSGTSVTIACKGGEEGKLFGSVGPIDIAGALRKEGFNIDKRQVNLSEPIREIGSYDVGIKLRPEVTCNVKVWVVKE